MEDLRRDGMRIQNNTVVNIEDEYVNLVREYKNKLFINVIDIHIIRCLICAQIY